MFKNIFSFSGRIRRQEYGITLLFFFLVQILLDLLLILLGKYAFIENVLLIPMFWILWAQAAKRCHDLGNSGWFQLIPLYVFWLLFKDGQLGKNVYGDNPKGIGNDSEIENIGKEIDSL